MRLKPNTNYSKMRNSELADEFMRWLSDIENGRAADTEQNGKIFMSLCQLIADRLRSADTNVPGRSGSFKKSFHRQFKKHVPVKQCAETKPENSKITE
jgi:hypothetical protein